MQHRLRQGFSELDTLLKCHDRLIEGILDLDADVTGRENGRNASIYSMDGISSGVRPVSHGLMLSERVRDRLEKLRLRIWLSMLEEIDKLREASSQESTHWLISKAGAESQQVSSIAWSVSTLVILLILFVPLITVTNIFSINIPIVTDHERAYKITLVVVGLLSFLSLFFISRIRVGA